MDDFIKKLADIYSKVGEVAKGTGRNMKRGLDGTAMEEMQRSEQAKNAELIEATYPGGMRGYMKDNGMMTEADIAAMGGGQTPFPEAPQGPQQYSSSIRALLNKP